MNLKKIAQKSERLDGSIIFHMMPFNSNWTLHRANEIEAALGALDGGVGDPRPREISILYQYAMPYIVDIEFPQNGAPDNAHIAGLREYWKAHKAFDADDFERFSAYVSMEMWLELSNAVAETRQSLPGPSGILGEPIPPEMLGVPVADEDKDPKGKPGTGKT